MIFRPESIPVLYIISQRIIGFTMISLKLADIFTNLAEVKKSVAGEKAAVLSLMMAARTLRDDPGIIEEILKGKSPGSSVGIDKYCYGLITEYLDKGSIGEYKGFSTSYSEDLVRFIRMTGLGRKRIFSIYDQFSIKDMEDLKSVFMDRDAAEVAVSSKLGKDVLNPLFAERIKWSIKYFDSIRKMIPRWPAEFYADIMIGELRKSSEIDRIEYTGSIRRKKSFIGDVDLLLLPVFNRKRYDMDRSEALLKKIAGYPFIKKLVSVKRTAEDISGLFNTIYEVDIEVIIASGNTWAWQLLKTTGSRKHLDILEEHSFRNSRPGLDDCIIRELGSEKRIYDALGLDHIPPELREGKDEVVRASQKMLPCLVRVDDIKGDLHIHSSWSDGLIDYSQMIDSARNMGYQYIAISDHSLSNYYGNGLDTGRLLEKMGFIGGLRKKYRDINILMGSEIDIKKPGVFDYDPDIIKKLDIAIASLHSGFVNSARENTLMAVSALEKEYFDLLAHPTGIVFGNRAPIFMDMEKVIEAAADHRKALEINSYYMRLDLHEEYACKAAEAGAKLAINTDSHRPGNMEMIRLGVDVARRAGLEAKDILNTMSCDELMSWRRER
jgi:DNA polymerase (family X)